MAQTPYSWGFDASGNWSDSSATTGWNLSGAYPNAAGDIASLSLDITGARVVSIDVTDAKVGSLTLNDTGSGGDSTWTIDTTDSTLNKLTFQTVSGNAAMTPAGATNVINAPVVLNSSLDLTATNSVNFTGAISGNGALNKSGAGILTLSGTTANTFSGTTTLNSGNLVLGKTAGQNAVSGNLTINAGTVSYNAANQIANTATVTLTGGAWNPEQNNETIANLTMSGGSVSISSGTGGSTTHTISGTTSLSGGTITLAANNSRTFNTGALNLSGGTITASAKAAGAVTVNTGAITITNTASGTYTALTLGNAPSGSNRTLVNMSGDLTFTGFSGNANSVTINDVNAGGTGINGLRMAGAGVTARTFTVNDGDAQVDLIIKPRIEGSGTAQNLIKDGMGTLQLDGMNSYTGTTTVNAGKLVIGSTGSLNSSSSVTISGSSAVLDYQGSSALTRDVTVGNGGTFIYNNSNAYSGALTLSNGSVGGSGNLGNTSLTVGSGVTLTPGNSPGLLTLGTLSLADGGNYNWQVLDAQQPGVAGTGFDSINLAGSLDLSSLTGTADFNINLWSLSSAGPDVNGDALNFNPNLSYTWTLISTNNTIVNFDASKFSINTGAINGAGGFTNLASGTFSVTLGDGNTDLLLAYNPVPEPAPVALCAMSLTILFWRRRGRQPLACL